MALRKTLRNGDFDKSRLPSRHVSVGDTSAPHRAFYYAMGMSEADIARPLVGVVTTWNEAAPCNISLSRQAQIAKLGVKAGGGSPREFTTITVTDGIAMGHAGMKSSLVSREVIADLVELTVRGHCYDGLVGIAGCDKSLPGIMMAMLRLNVPSVFLYGGSILPGKFQGRDVTIVDVFEGVGARAAGRMTAAELHELECAACPSAGSCGGQFTANTMACVSEALGLALPGSAMPPAPYESRDVFAEAAGLAVMELIKRQLRPRDIVTLKALENAASVVAASGGSTNAGLHLPAIANEAGIPFTLADLVAISRRTPYIANLKPGGKYVAKDLYDVGGVPVLMKALLDGGYLHGDCLTVSGKTIAENLKDVVVPKNQDVVCSTEKPLSKSGGLIGLTGNLAPEGAIVKVAGMKRLKFSGRARCFDREEDALKAVLARKIKAGDVVVVRYEGPKGGPGMREMLFNHKRHLRPGPRRGGRPHYRRTLLGRHARLLDRPYRPRGGCRRSDSTAQGRRPHRHRRRQGHAQRGALERGARQAPQELEAAPARLPVRHALALCPERRAGPHRCGHSSRCRSRDALLRGYLRIPSPACGRGKGPVPKGWEG